MPGGRKVANFPEFFEIYTKMVLIAAVLPPLLAFILLAPSPEFKAEKRLHEGGESIGTRPSR
ncbi:hypothetical protein JCGZ_13621 [Jatropha curcas]|uniref:Uncharacterized protein n=1 Tax=Jatropha curcas TaxID=180498 RepID=A0A067KL84_JATCU|nr:hypothetical protein JCGZ_02846 [Jatropha curcas]KDP22744.1 hypothetical protein JCGZ_02403 [Jatropha curcas]KDP33035.1 hypothetical protein JCGZ_13621 [Jatropha curcas]